MNILLLVALTLVAVVYFWFWWRRKTGKVTPRVEDEFEDLNEKFLRNAGQKDGTVDLVRVYEPGDLTLLRSLLDTEGLESYVLESQMGSLYPLETIPGFADSTVTVYRVDYEAGRRVVEDFLAEDAGFHDRESCRPVLLDLAAN